MYQLVLKNGRVVATHEVHQDVSDAYPGCEIVTMSRPLPLDEAGDWLSADPRTDEEKKQAYKDRRRLEYPTVADQLDMLYHDALDGTTTWRDAITVVKDRHPKPVDEERT